MEAQTDESTQCNGEPSPVPIYSHFATAGFVAVTIGVLLCLAANLFLFVHRQTPIVQISQAALLHLYCFGFLTLNISGYLRLLNSFWPVSTDLCMGQLWLVHCSLTFIISILTAKEWRTWKLRTYSARMRKYAFTINHILAYVACSLAITCIILITWTVVEPSRPDPCETYQCTSHSVGGFWAAIGFQAVQAGLLLVVAYLDWNLGQVGGENAGIMVTAMSLVSLTAVFFATGLYNAPTASDEGSGRANAVEALVSYSTCTFLTGICLTATVFTKARYTHLTSEEIVERFLQPSRPTSTRSNADYNQLRQQQSATGTMGGSKAPASGTRPSEARAGPGVDGSAAVPPCATGCTEGVYRSDAGQPTFIDRTATESQNGAESDTAARTEDQDSQGQFAGNALDALAQV